MEKRTHKRLSKRDRPEGTVIRFAVQGEIDPRRAEKTAFLMDISPSGVGLRTDEPLELGQTLMFCASANHPDLQGAGQVIWTAESREGFRIGIRFV